MAKMTGTFINSELYTKASGLVRAGDLIRLGAIMSVQNGIASRVTCTIKEY